MEAGALDDITSYALIVLRTKRAQANVAMGVSSDDSVKVWVNGEVVHTNATNRGRGNDNTFQDHLKVDLKKGNNLIMIKVSERTGGWGMHFGVGGDYELAEINAILPVEPAGKSRFQLQDAIGGVTPKRELSETLLTSPRNFTELHPQAILF